MYIYNMPLYVSTFWAYICIKAVKVNDMKVSYKK